MDPVLYLISINCPILIIGFRGNLIPDYCILWKILSFFCILCQQRSKTFSVSTVVVSIGRILQIDLPIVSGHYIRLLIINKYNCLSSYNTGFPKQPFTVIASLYHMNLRRHCG